MFKTDIGEVKFWKGGFYSKIIHTRSYYTYIKQIMYYNLVNAGLTGDEGSIWSSFGNKEDRLKLSTFFAPEENRLMGLTLILGL